MWVYLILSQMDSLPCVLLIMEPVTLAPSRMQFSMFSVCHSVIYYFSFIISVMPLLLTVAHDAVSCSSPSFYCISTMLQPFYGLASGFYVYPVSFHRTLRRFPHRLTISAFNYFASSHHRIQSVFV